MKHNNEFKFLPEVLRSKGVQPFNPEKIRDSLIKETECSVEIANFLTQKVCSFLIASRIERVTGPLIREVCCVIALMHEFPEIRKKYSRVGMPPYEIDKILKKHPVKATQILGDHMIKEHYALKRLQVKKLIDKVGKENNESKR